MAKVADPGGVRRLSQLADQVCAADPRTKTQRRADALAACETAVGTIVFAKQLFAGEGCR